MMIRQVKIANPKMKNEPVKKEGKYSEFNTKNS